MSSKTSSLDEGWCETYCICSLLLWSVQSLGGSIESMISVNPPKGTLGFGRGWWKFIFGFFLVICFHVFIDLHSWFVFDKGVWWNWPIHELRFTFKLILKTIIIDSKQLVYCKSLQGRNMICLLLMGNKLITYLDEFLKTKINQADQRHR